MNITSMLLMLGAAGLTGIKELVDSKDREKKQTEQMRSMINEELNKRFGIDKEEP
mgnify:CR=1 FL=1